MDTKTLNDLYQIPFDAAPVVTIYLDTTGDVENSAQQVELRWKDVLRELADAGVDEATRERLTAARGSEPHRLGGTRVLVAAGGDVVLATSLPQPPVVPMVRVEALPYLLPYVRAVATQVPHLLVMTDRQGADILRYTDSPAPDEVIEVSSGRHPLHKTGTGGWAALRYEHTVQENWKASEKDVAAAVTEAADQVGARLIVAAGDVYAVDGLHDQLHPRLQAHFVRVDGGRATDGSEHLMAERVAATVEDFLDGQAVDLLTDFAMYRNRARKLAEGEPLGEDAVAANAADGPRETIAALQQAQVGTLLVTEQLDADSPAWFGPDATHIAMDADDLRALGVQDPRQGCLADVLLRAALGTDAEVRTVPYDEETAPRSGVGALLRYTNAGTQS